MMAGCINQAKKILSKYDEVLFGPAPEVLIEPTHQAIRKLFASPEGKTFVARMAEGKEGSAADDTFIKGVIGAIPPVIPLAIRNKNLDGGFLRTALLLLGAVEILLAQYEVDIRSNANPAGVVGMSAAMHADSSDATCLVKNFGVCETSRRRCGPNTRLRWDWARRFRMIRCHGRVRGVRLGTITTVLLGGASFVGPVSDEGSRRRQQPPGRGALSVTTTSLATAGEERRADTTIRINEQLRSYITRKCALCSS